MQPLSTILVVDDHPLGRDILENLLHSPNYRILSAENGQQALDLAYQMRPDLILLDAMMPEMDGFEVCQRLRAEPRCAEIPIIMVTALNDRLSRLQAIQAGADDFISKPFDRDELRARVQMITRMNRYRRLIEERTRFERLTELSPDGILLLDEEGHIRLANPALLHMLQIPTEESLLDLLISEMIEPPYQTLWNEHLNNILCKHCDPVRMQAVFYSPQGRHIPVEINAGYFELEGRPMAQMVVRDYTERIEAEEALRKQADRLGILHDLDQAILEARSPQAIAQTTLNYLRSLIPCQQAYVVVFDFASNQAQILAAYALDYAMPNAGAILPLPQFPITEEMRQGHTLLVDNLPGSEQSDWVKQYPLFEGMRSLISAPLMVQEQIIGSLNLGAGQPGAFAPASLEIIHEVTRPLSIGIQQAQLHQQLQRHATSLEEAVARRTQELQAERDRTRAILESLGEAVVVADANGFILYANPAATALTSYNFQELLGQNLNQWNSTPASSEQEKQVTALLRSGETWRGETSNRRKDNTPYNAAVTLAPLFAPDEGIYLGTVAVFRDVTPLKQAERMKDQFVSNVSHELRTPLSLITLISGNLDLLYERLDDEQRRKMIRDLRARARLLEDLINDILDISRIDSLSISMERQALELVNLTYQEAEKLTPLAARKFITLTISGAKNLPCYGSDGQIRQVVRNIINNAIKYTHEGGQITCDSAAIQINTPGSPLIDPPPESDLPSAWPGCTELPAGSWAALRIIDNGIGIAPQHMPRLFERFFRVEVQSQIPGTGLGLAIARDLVNMHGGHIAAASRPQEGSTFAIYLPSLPEDEDLATLNRSDRI